MIDFIKSLNVDTASQYLQDLSNNPFKLIGLILDIVVVLYLGYEIIKIAKGTRVGQLVKGILFLVIITLISNLLELKILNYILTSFMTYGVLALIVLFQPELRRALEQLGTSSGFRKYFGVDSRDIVIRMKENVYKVCGAVMDLSNTKTGALIVWERDIKIRDSVSNGVSMNAEISPQLLVNIFTPKTPLHDGATVISGHKILAAACMLPLASDKDIAKELGTRHRAAIGVSKETDAVAIVVSEETGKVSIARDGTLIADVKEETLKKILIKNIVTDKYSDNVRRIRVKKV
jgi:diadenylate cyclase